MKKWILLLCVGTGFVISAYLSFLMPILPDLCGTIGCDNVLNSPFSKPFGLPISVYAMAAFLFLLGNTTKLWHSEARHSSIAAMTMVSGIGTLAALVLIGIQAFIIQSWCLLCLALSTCFVASFAIVWLLKQQIGISIIDELIADWPRQLKWGSIALIIPIALHINPGSRQERMAGMIGGRPITLDALDRSIGPNFFKLDRQLFELRTRKWHEMVLMTEAKQRDLSVQDLLSLALQEAGVTVTEDDIRNTYVQYKKHLGNRRLDEVRNQVVQWAARDKTRPIITAYINTLKNKHKAQRFFPLPKDFIIKKNPIQEIEIGPKNAPLTIVSFSDFECTYCKDAHDKAEAFRKKHPEKARFIFRQYPLSAHPGARDKAKAAICADQQNGYPTFARELYDNTTLHGQDNLLTLAKELGFDEIEFKRCMETERTKRTLAADLAEKTRLGLSATPVYFVNNHYFAGFPDDTTLLNLIPKPSPKKANGPKQE